MRDFRHTICQSKSGKSVIFKVDVNDIFGKHEIKFTSVTGWRSKLALNHLFFETDEWNDDAARKYVCIQVLRCAKNKNNALDSISSPMNLINHQRFIG
jgi:hypothetical protein